jgi:hypothetical protein
MLHYGYGFGEDIDEDPCAFLALLVRKDLVCVRIFVVARELRRLHDIVNGFVCCFCIHAPGEHAEVFAASREVRVWCGAFETFPIR